MEYRVTETVIRRTADTSDATELNGNLVLIPLSNTSVQKEFIAY